MCVLFSFYSNSIDDHVPLKCTRQIWKKSELLKWRKDSFSQDRHTKCLWKISRIWLWILPFEGELQRLVKRNVYSFYCCWLGINPKLMVWKIIWVTKVSISNFRTLFLSQLRDFRKQKSDEPQKIFWRYLRVLSCLRKM